MGSDHVVGRCPSREQIVELLGSGINRMGIGTAMKRSCRHGTRIMSREKDAMAATSPCSSFPEFEVL